ncbi:MAG: SCO family protein [Betaproteobacteria bacterium]
MVRASLTRRGFLAALAAAASAPPLLVACGRQAPERKFHATDITGVDWGRGFELTDHHGRRRSLADFRGKVVMLFFGYTSCPDACPLALAEMAEAVRRLGQDGARVQGLFATVDPERDTPKVLSSYVAAFHPGFLGLRGTPEETERLAKEFKIHYRADKTHAGHGGHYMVDHSTGILVFDARGEPRLYISQNGRSVERIVEDLERLLAASEKEAL